VKRASVTLTEAIRSDGRHLEASASTCADCAHLNAQPHAGVDSCRLPSAGRVRSCCVPCGCECLINGTYVSLTRMPLPQRESGLTEPLPQTWTCIRPYTSANIKKSPARNMRTHRPSRDVSASRRLEELHDYASVIVVQPSTPLGANSPGERRALSGMVPAGLYPQLGSAHAHHSVERTFS